MWILVALREEPRNVVRLLDDVRALDGRVGHGTFLGAVARLERLALIESTTNGGRPAYRLTERGPAGAAASAHGGAPS